MVPKVYTWIYANSIEQKDIEDVWATWELLQKRTHFLCYQPLQDYYKLKPLPEWLSGGISIFHERRFGLFSPLMIPQKTALQIIELIKILIEIYDYCKGTLRFLRFDNPAIRALRLTVRFNSFLDISKEPTDQYYYDYNRVHAHTIAQYSLSTLLMRIVLHQLGGIMPDKYRAITLY
jgi:hypothetical protein